MVSVYMNNVTNIYIKYSAKIQQEWTFNGGNFYMQSKLCKFNPRITREGRFLPETLNHHLLVGVNYTDLHGPVIFPHITLLPLLWFNMDHLWKVRCTCSDLKFEVIHQAILERTIISSSALKKKHFPSCWTFRFRASKVKIPSLLNISTEHHGPEHILLGWSLYCPHSMISRTLKKRNKLVKDSESVTWKVCLSQDSYIAGSRRPPSC